MLRDRARSVADILVFKFLVLIILPVIYDPNIISTLPDRPNSRLHAKTIEKVAMYPFYSCLGKGYPALIDDIDPFLIKDPAVCLVLKVRFRLVFLTKHLVIIPDTLFEREVFPQVFPYIVKKAADHAGLASFKAAKGCKVDVFDRHPFPLKACQAEDLIIRVTCIRF